MPSVDNICEITALEIYNKSLSYVQNKIVYLLKSKTLQNK